jgi:hypothetical protein
MSVTDLRKLFDDLAGSPAPPTRMAADATFAEGRRRWRRRRAVTAAAATMAVALTAGGIGVATAGGPTASAPVAPAASDGAALPRQGILQWIGAADARHVYAARSACPDGSCPKWIIRLLGSDDGGRTWTERHDRVSVIGLEVLAPDVLVSAGPTPAAPNLSTDGGRTWRAATYVDTPRPAGGGVLYCAHTRQDDACEVTVLDPAAGTYGRLATPPAVTGIPAGVVETVGGAAWVAGTRVGGTDQGRPAVAVTTDAGRTWSTHSFADPAGCVNGACTTEVTTVDGRTAYVVVANDANRRQTVYHHGADGRWKRLDGAEKVPYSALGGSTSFVLPDGTHVMREIVSDRPNQSRIRYWAGRGGTYRPIELAGLPATAYPIRRAPDGWYYTYAHGDGELYGSADGLHWTPIGQR